MIYSSNGQPRKQTIEITFCRDEQSNNYSSCSVRTENPRAEYWEEIFKTQINEALSQSSYKTDKEIEAVTESIISQIPYLSGYKEHEHVLVILRT